MKTTATTQRPQDRVPSPTARSREARPSGVTLIPRMRRSDARGWLLKVLAGTERDLRREVGEAYVVMAEPGEVRGNHRHELTAEWFTVIDGEADIFLRNEHTGIAEALRLRAADSVTLHVPPGVAHAFRNPDDASGPLVVVAYADRRYDPSDTIADDVVAEHAGTALGG